MRTPLNAVLPMLLAAGLAVTEGRHARGRASGSSLSKKEQSKRKAARKREKLGRRANRR